MSIFTKAFAQDAAERACKTAAQAAIVVLTGNAVSLWTLDYKSLLSAVVLGAAISVLTSIASAAATGTPSGSAIE